MKQYACILSNPGHATVGSGAGPETAAVPVLVEPSMFGIAFLSLLTQAISPWQNTHPVAPGYQASIRLPYVHIRPSEDS